MLGQRWRDRKRERDTGNIRSVRACEVPYASDICSMVSGARFPLSVLIPAMLVNKGEAPGIFLRHSASLFSYK